VSKAKHKTIKHAENAKLDGGTLGFPGGGRGLPLGDRRGFSGRAGEGDGVGEGNGDGVGEGDEKSSGDEEGWGFEAATGAGELEDSSTHASIPRFTNVIILAPIPTIQ
jgi:hypothetical protein